MVAPVTFAKRLKARLVLHILCPACGEILCRAGNSWLECQIVACKLHRVHIKMPPVDRLDVNLSDIVYLRRPSTGK